MEEEVKQEGKDLKQMSLPEMDEVWNKIKARQKS